MLRVHGVEMGPPGCRAVWQACRSQPRPMSGGGPRPSCPCPWLVPNKPLRQSTLPPGSVGENQSKWPNCLCWHLEVGTGVRDRDHGGQSCGLVGPVDLGATGPDGGSPMESCGAKTDSTGQGHMHVQWPGRPQRGPRAMTDSFSISKVKCPRPMRRQSLAVAESR